MSKLSKKSSEITRAEIAKKALPGETWEMTTYRLKDEQNQDTGTGAQILGEKQFELPLWPEDDRAAPSAIVRSSLFGLVKRGTRRAMTRELLATWKGDEIRYTGQQLDQSDMDVWMQLAHMSVRHEMIDEPISCTEHQLLKDMGRSISKQNYEWLRRSMARMKATAVEVTKNGKQTYCGSLIEKFWRDEETRDLKVELDLNLSSLFDPNHTRVLLENRKNLKTQLAKWLHCYIASHQQGKIHRLGMNRLQKLSGSTSQIREFRRKLKRDMTTLQEHGIVTTWRITEGDSLEFIRPTKNQIKKS